METIWGLGLAVHGMYCIGQACLKLVILLPQAPKC